MQGNWNAKVRKDACKIRIREDSDFWSLPPLTISCWQTLLVITQNGQHHNQIDYILMRKRFRSGVNSARTRSFPGADIGSDHDLLMMAFHLRLKKINKPKHTRLKVDIKKLKDSSVLETFQAMIGGKFAPVTNMSNEDADMD